MRTLEPTEFIFGMGDGVLPNRGSAGYIHRYHGARLFSAVGTERRAGRTTTPSCVFPVPAFRFLLCSLFCIFVFLSVFVSMFNYFS